jgi:prepilin-type N-terminal cleavage/methylation domain-containing protein
MRSKGFALLELIVTLVAIGIMAAMIAPFFVSEVTRGPVALNTMPYTLTLQGVMGKIIEDYNNNPATYQVSGGLSTLSGNIGNAAYASANYGIDGVNYTVVKNITNFKFRATDQDSALQVTIKDNTKNETLTYIFTRQM